MQLHANLPKSGRLTLAQETMTDAELVSGSTQSTETVEAMPTQSSSKISELEVPLQSTGD